VAARVVADVAEAAVDVGAETLSGLRDQIGLSWRPALAAGILSNLDKIDLVEVIADDFFDASRRDRRALQTLARHTPVTLHGVSLGLASAVAVEPRRLDRMARLCADVAPVSWSEHLAFVRGGGIEIGHLAAPPRTNATIDGALTNLARASKIVGAAPHVENVATLIDPPGSDLDEVTWVTEIVMGSAADLLLDLHNLHANATNFGFNPKDFIAKLPAERIAAIHLAGGKWIGEGGNRRLLDDHLHDVPDSVYDLLTEVGACAKQPLTVILERDGHFPSIDCLLHQLEQARQALARGRERLIAKSRKEAA
jgi:uncharacterized protein (UPF0276 family)